MVLLTALLAVLFISCDNTGIYEGNINMDGSTWQVSDTATFSVSIPDSLAFYNLFVNIRNTVNYPNQNLFLFITTYAPSGASAKDTLELFLADDSGKWLGKGFGSIRDSQFPYRLQAKFSSSGVFRFEIQHAMRAKSLEGIYTVGLRVEKASPPGEKVSK